MSQAASVLQRASRIPDGAGQFLGDLPTHCSEELGYHRLRNEQAHISIMRALAEIKRLPFKTKSVEDYKLRALAEHSPENYARMHDMERLYEVTRFGLIALPLGAVFGSMINLVLGGVLLLAMLFCGFIQLRFQMINTYIVRKPEWKIHDLEGYLGIVPEFALQAAVELKRKLPTVRFEVHELVQDKRVIDPFLVAVFNDQRYYFCVWDENSFTAEATA